LGILLDDKIMQELRADRLSDTPSDRESDKSCDDDDDDNFEPSASQKGRKRARLEVSDPDANTDDDSDGGCSENDYLRNLEKFLGNTNVTFTPNDPTSISDVVNRFLGNDFPEILVDQSNLFHAQNADKYKNSCKSLAWKDISITDMKKFEAIIILMDHVKKEKTGDNWQQ
jgi:hypothetical protein